MAMTRVILITQPRLLCEMLKRVLAKAENIEVVGEISSISELDSALQKIQIDWVIFFPNPEEDFTRTLRPIFLEHPSLRVLVVANDGSRVTMRWVEFHEKPLERLKIDELVALLGTDQNLTQPTHSVDTGLGLNILSGIQGIFPVE
jgi:chemotaxis response regulator CheB